MTNRRTCGSCEYWTLLYVDDVHGKTGKCKNVAAIKLFLDLGIDKLFASGAPACNKFKKRERKTLNADTVR